MALDDDVPAYEPLLVGKELFDASHNATGAKLSAAHTKLKQRLTTQLGVALRELADSGACTPLRAR